MEKKNWETLSFSRRTLFCGVLLLLLLLDNNTDNLQWTSYSLAGSFYWIALREAASSYKGVSTALINPWTQLPEQCVC